MKIDNVADLIAETLAQAGVKRIFGVVGDSLNGLTDALRKRKAIDWIHVRHEEVAAFAAAGEAQITGELAVCAGSCGPGNLHLINGLFDAHRSRTPVLAIAAQFRRPKSAAAIFRRPSAGPVPGMQPLLRTGVRSGAIALRAGKRHSRGGGAARRCRHRHPRRRRVAIGAEARHLTECRAAAGGADRSPAESELEALANLLNGAKRVTLFCGRGCAGAHDGLMQLAETLKSPIVHALGGKEHVEFDNPYDVGMTGFIGFSSGYAAMLACDVLLMLGSIFPTSSFCRRMRRSRKSTSGRKFSAAAASSTSALSATSAPPSSALLPKLKAKK